MQVEPISNGIKHDSLWCEATLHFDFLLKKKFFSFFFFPREAEFHQHMKPFRAGGTLLLLGSLAPSDTGKICPFYKLESTSFSPSCTTSPGAIPLLHMHHILIPGVSKANCCTACLKFLLSRQESSSSKHSALYAQQWSADSN